MSASSYQVKRLHDQPLVSDGHNTNGPSVIKVPHWLGVDQRPFTIKNGKNRRQILPILCKSQWKIHPHGVES